MWMVHNQLCKNSLVAWDRDVNTGEGREDRERGARLVQSPALKRLQSPPVPRTPPPHPHWSPCCLLVSSVAMSQARARLQAAARQRGSLTFTYQPSLDTEAGCDLCSGPDCDLGHYLVPR